MESFIRQKIIPMEHDAQGGEIRWGLKNMVAAGVFRIHRLAVGRASE